MSILGLIIVLLVVLNSQMGEVFVARTHEVSEPGSSGNARMVKPYQELMRSWTESSTSLLFGIGAGGTSTWDTDTEASFPPFTKVGIEFGLLGVAAFVALWLSQFRGLVLPVGPTIGLLVFYFVASGGSFVQPWSVFPIWSLTLGFKRTTPTAAQGTSAARA
jgi:hypothetical protein